ncbi:MAG: alpha-ribazole phosphatase [Pelosinus sp.]|nr:alpha-ribazole phosphatase [Pelosinus sp.]
MTKVILVRHGQTLWNVDCRYQGQSDVSLNETGLKQARLLAARLLGEDVAAIYASDLGRAKMTAEEIAKRHNLAVSIVPELREISFGEWEGMTFGEIDEKWPGLMSRIFKQPDTVEIPGGETYQAVQQRATQAIDKLVKKHPEETIIVVSHGATIRTILCAALEVPLTSVWRIRQDNTAVNVIEYSADNWASVALINDIHHLKER